MVYTSPMATGEGTENGKAWRFLTNHGHVFLELASNPDVRISELSDLVGITERAVVRILRDLESDGYVEVIREGRRNRYRVHANLPMRHPNLRDHAVGELVKALG